MNNLISRQSAIDALCKACANGEDYLRCRDRDIKSRWCDTITALRDLPSVQSQQVTGKLDADCISRKAAIDALKSQLSDWNDDYNIPVRKSIENIERLPSAQPEQRWTPCNERLPEDNGNYLVTYIYKDDEKGTEEPYVISDNFMLWKGAFATEEPTDKAQAWMPLPEPYAERGTNETNSNLD